MAIFDCAEWKPVQNHGGAMNRSMGLLLHHAVANGSLYGWFNNPASQVSAHFWVSKTGLIEQYVDSEEVAWHAMQMNDNYCGVETEGCVQGPDEGNIWHGWPNQLANSDGETGFGFHRMGVQTGCPCDIRLNKRSDILAKAFGSAPVTPPSPSGIPPLHVDYFGVSHNATCSDVSVWQGHMAFRGWTIMVDGDYGPQSEEVCRQFQSEKRLVVDGLFGSATWDATWTEPIT